MPAALLITFGMDAARLMPQYPVCVVLSAITSSHHRVGKQAKVLAALIPRLTKCSAWCSLRSGRTL